jgi:hypothetical protein
MKSPRPQAFVVLAVVAGTLMAVLLGLLTSGVQASVDPDGLPLAVAVPEGDPVLRDMAQNLAAQAGHEVAVRITTPDQARALLDDKAVYGVLELAVTSVGVSPTVVLSGAINPSGTQAAQVLLVEAGDAVSAAAARQLPGAAPQPVTVEIVHEASAAGRAAPLAASQLLWIGCLVGSVLIVAIAQRTGTPVHGGVRLAAAFVVPVGVTAGFVGLMALWDSGLRIDARLMGFLLFTALAFALVQGAVLRLLGIAGMAILAPLFLMAPAVAGQVPELLHPAYRELLWSWTPFRFSTEGVRSLLYLDGVAPDVRTALWVLGVMAVAGLAVLVLPARRSPRASAPLSTERVEPVPVPVHSA